MSQPSITRPICPQRMWEDYVFHCDRNSRLAAIKSEDMTQSLWEQWHESREVITRLEGIYDRDELLERYKASLQPQD